MSAEVLSSPDSPATPTERPTPTPKLYSQRYVDVVIDDLHRKLKEGRSRMSFPFESTTASSEDSETQDYVVPAIRAYVDSRDEGECESQMDQATGGLKKFLEVGGASKSRKWSGADIVSTLKVKTQIPNLEDRWKVKGNVKWAEDLSTTRQDSCSDIKEFLNSPRAQSSKKQTVSAMRPQSLSPVRRQTDSWDSELPQRRDDVFLSKRLLSVIDQALYGQSVSYDPWISRTRDLLEEQDQSATSEYKEDPYLPSPNPYLTAQPYYWDSFWWSLPRDYRETKLNWLLAAERHRRMREDSKVRGESSRSWTTNTSSLKTTGFDSGKEIPSENRKSYSLAGDRGKSASSHERPYDQTRLERPSYEDPSIYENQRETASTNSSPARKISSYHSLRDAPCPYEFRSKPEEYLRMLRNREEERKEEKTREAEKTIPTNKLYNWKMHSNARYPDFFNLKELDVSQRVADIHKLY